MRKKIVSIVLVMLSPLIYYYLTFLFRVNITYQLIYSFEIKSKILVASVILLSDFVCAIIIAGVTAWPLSYLFKFKPTYITLVLLITILGFPAFTFIVQSNFNYLASIDIIGQFVSVSIFIYYFAKFGYRAAQKKDHQLIKS